MVNTCAACGVSGSAKKAIAALSTEKFELPSAGAVDRITVTSCGSCPVTLFELQEPRTVAAASNPARVARNRGERRVMRSPGASGDEAPHGGARVESGP